MDIKEEFIEKTNKVKFIYKKPEDYQIYYSNGVFGAITPRGDFEFSFFFEHREMPEEEIMSVEEGLFKIEEQNIKDITIVRDLNVGVIMTLEQAESLGNWLLEKVEEFGKRKTEKEKNV